MYCKYSIDSLAAVAFFGINSSKVYCKLVLVLIVGFDRFVLIVAKCIVNGINSETNGAISCVLIVAKCIVNIYIYFSIN